jgi:hypothetical protein
MARAYGSSAHLLMKRETTYGQAATGNYIRMPFNRCDLGSEQGLIDDPVLGQGRDPLAPLQDVVTDEGDIVVPVDLEFAYTLSAQAKLVLTAHEVYLPKPKLAEGPGGVQASLDFRGAKKTDAGCMRTVTLTNDLDGLVYG